MHADSQKIPSQGRGRVRRAATPSGPRARHSRRLTLLTVGTLLVPAGAAAQGVHQTARSDAGMVVAAHPLATVAGTRILEMGGNAADAALATAFAVAVVRPSMNGIGGRNQVLVRTADGQVHGIDGTTQAPLGYDAETAPRARHGYPTVGVPGALAGLIKLHLEHGNLPLDVIVEPAVEYAERGFRLLPQQARFHASVRDALAESEGARHYYLKGDGSAYREGELLVQADLGATLKKIARGGAEVFYRGELADVMIADMEKNGGFVDRESLSSYQALDSRIVRGSYRGYDLVGMDVPAAGAVAIQALQIMEAFDPAAHDDDGWAAVAGQAIALASSDFRGLGSDSAAVRATSKAWARTQAERVRVPAATTDGAGAEASGSPQIEVPAGPAEGDDPHYTTHLSVVDGDGMAVSLTQTLGPAMGSRVAVPGMGMLYAATLGGYLSGDMAPGTRARSFISPLMVLKEGELLMVLGAAGGARIVSSVVQAVSRVVDDGMTLPRALAAPRVHMGFEGAMEMEMSAGWTDEDLDEVRALGLEAEGVERVGAFGRVQAIGRADAGQPWTGASDPDSEGTARAPVQRP